MGGHRQPCQQDGKHRSDWKDSGHYFYILKSTCNAAELRPLIMSGLLSCGQESVPGRKTVLDLILPPL